MEGVCEQTPPQPPGGPTTTQGRWGERQAEKRLLEAAEGLGTVLQCRLHCRQAQWRPHTSWSHLREPRPLHDVCSLDTGLSKGSETASSLWFKSVCNFVFNISFDVSSPILYFIARA